MTQGQLDRLEREVETARARFAADLARIRAPSTLSDFKNDLMAEASETKDELVEKTKRAGTEGAQRLVANLKDRAAANPAAALAIGAGLAWRIAHRPPIASMLIGLGLYSLWRTSASGNGDGVAAQTARVAGAATERAREWTAQAGETLTELAEHASATADRVVTSTQEKLQSLKQTATTAAEDTVNQLGERAATVGEKASTALQDLAPGEDTRDKLLLGAAALAVAAAVGIAYQRGTQEESRS